jgi:hypothetical protein
MAFEVSKRWLADKTIYRKARGNLERFDSSAEQVENRGATAYETLFWAHTDRLVHKWVHFLPIYDQLLSPYRNGFTDAGSTPRPLRFLELGVSHGGSQQIWRKYLGPNAILFGIDVEPRCADIDDANLNIRIGSQADPKFLKEVVTEMGGVDVVLDDGSHVAEHQLKSFETLFPLLTEGGLYIVEDVHTAYWRKWQGGYRRQGSWIEVCKDLIDDMHSWYHSHEKRHKCAAHDIESITVFDSVVAIRKRKQSEPRVVRVGSRMLNKKDY